MGDHENTNNDIWKILVDHKLAGDKVKYSNYYSHLLGQIRKSVQNVLEIGVGSGSSLILWREYFPNIKRIVGIDQYLGQFPDYIDYDHVDYSDDDHYELYISADGIIEFYMMDAYNIKSFNIIKNEVSGADMDMVMDDGDHVIDQWKFFIDYYDSLSSKGLVIIEDASKPNLQELSDYSDKYRFVGNYPNVWGDHEILPKELWFDTAESLYIHDKRG